MFPIAAIASPELGADRRDEHLDATIAAIAPAELDAAVVARPPWASACSPHDSSEARDRDAGACSGGTAAGRPDGTLRHLVANGSRRSRSLGLVRVGCRTC
jgi:hypothetical protein